jgi:hypothetical protein
MNIPTQVLIPLLLEEKITIEDLTDNDLSSLHQLLMELNKFHIRLGNDEESRAREEIQENIKDVLECNLLKLILLHRNSLEATQALEIMKYLTNAGSKTRSMAEIAILNKLHQLKR